MQKNQYKDWADSHSAIVSPQEIWKAARKQALQDCVEIAMRYAKTSYQANIIAKDIENLNRLMT